MDYQQLVQRYLDHPMHEGLTLTLSSNQGTSTLGITIHPGICNLVGTLHGSYYFKCMDDACFFAAISLKKHHFVATATFTHHYIKPASSGVLTAKAKVINQQGSKYICDCMIYNDKDEQCAYGSGLFVAPKQTYNYKI